MILIDKILKEVSNTGFQEGGKARAACAKSAHRMTVPF
jgi:hypothetical protein